MALGGVLQSVSRLHGPLLNLSGAGTEHWRCHGDSKGVGADDIPTVAPVGGLMHAVRPNGDGTEKRIARVSTERGSVEHQLRGSLRRTGWRANPGGVHWRFSLAGALGGMRK
jgi:hypothetical protein